MPAIFSILLVDDDKHIAEVLIRAARETFPEARLLIVQNYDQAVAYLEETTGEAPQLILLDIDLQTGPSGLDFLSLLRKHPQGRSIPTVILSHLEDEATIAEAYKREANFYSQKPFTFTGWKEYVARLRRYWFTMVARPTLWLDGKSRT